MVRRLASWLIRVGAVLGIASFFIPQFEVSWARGAVLSPLSTCLLLRSVADFETFALDTAMELMPVLGCLWVLAASYSRPSGWPALRGAGIAFLFVWSFALATLGSLICTLPTSASGVFFDSSSGLLLFILPLILAAILLARVLGGSPPEATAKMVGGGLGLLLLIRSFAAFQATVVTAWGPGAIVPMAAGASIVAGAVLSLASPRSPTPPARAAAEGA